MSRAGSADRPTRNSQFTRTFQITFPAPTRPGLAGLGLVAGHPGVINVARSCLLDGKGENMLEDYVRARITLKRLKGGPAANDVDDFSDWLHARGHNKRSLFRMLQSFAKWTDRLSKTGRLLKTSRKGCRNALSISRQLLISHMNAAPGVNLSVSPRLFLRFLGNGDFSHKITGADSLACSLAGSQRYAHDRDLSSCRSSRKTRRDGGSSPAKPASRAIQGS
jgi:hypothetical protein